MDENEMCLVIKDLLAAADRHPNSKVSKLIHAVQEDKDQKTIVMLVMELAEHAEYATDFTISLRYYLELFDKHSDDQDIILNEAGLLILNAAKIYARRVDCVYEMVERQLLTIADTNKELEEATNKEQEANNIKQKKGRKRIVVHNDPFEIELSPKKFRKIDDKRRFIAGKVSSPPLKTKSLPIQLPCDDCEQQPNPACWLHSRIVDFDNEDNVDTKRNYKLFTYHIEHRYNTLVPDINFRLHFKVKDYLDQEAEDDEMEEDITCRRSERQWPCLDNREHAQKYLLLENEMIAMESMDMETPNSKRRRKQTWTTPPVDTRDAADSSLITIGHHLRNVLESVRNEPASEKNCDETTSPSNSLNDSGFLSSQNSNLSQNNTCTDGSVAETSIENETNNDTSLDKSGKSLENSSFQETTSDSITASDANANTNESSIALDTSNNETNINASDIVALINSSDSTDGFEDIRVHLPYLADEGVFLSDLDEHDFRMLSPTVVATDVLPAVPNKKDLSIIIDDEIKALLNLPEDEPETYRIQPELSNVTALVHNILKINETFLRRRTFFKLELEYETNKSHRTSLKHNIFQFNETIVRRRVLFKLGSEYDLYKQARLLKRPRGDVVSEPRKYKLNEWFALDATSERSIVFTPSPESLVNQDDFLGYAEETDLEEFEGFSDEDVIVRSTLRHSQDSGLSEIFSPGAVEPTRSIDVLMEASINLQALVDRSNNDEHSVNNDNVDNTSKTEDSVSQPLIENQTIGPADNEESNAEEQPFMEHSTFDTEEAADKTNQECPNNEPSRESTLSIMDNHELHESSDELDLNTSKTKVQKWHEHLQPILKNARERHHFDVFAIGTEIMDKFHTPTREKSKAQNESYKVTTFADVMENKDKSYVSRYFLSTLLLVNQGNVAINVQNKDSGEPTAWEDIHLELQSTKRHTVAIEDNIGMIETPLRSSTSTSTSVAAKRTIIADKSRNSLENFSKSAHLTSTPVQARSSKASSSTRSLVNATINTITALRPIEKSIPKDDSDSGIYSREESAISM